MSSKFEIMEQRDEDQILAEAQGNIIKEMFYKFPLDGKTVVGISWVGTKEIARRYGGIKMGIPVVTDLGDQYACSVQATDTKNDVTLVGSSLQPKMMTKRSGEEVPDRFAYTKVTSKAQRNAIRALIPETFLLAMEKSFSTDSKPPTRRKTKVKVTDNPTKWDGDLTPANMQAYLVTNGFEGEKFKFRDDKPTGMIICDSSPFVDNFDFLRAVYTEMGGEYHKDWNVWVFRY